MIGCLIEETRGSLPISPNRRSNSNQLNSKKFIILSTMTHLLVKTSKYHLTYSTMVNNYLSKLPIFYHLPIAYIVDLFPFVVSFCRHLLVTLIIGHFFVPFVFAFVVLLCFGPIALTIMSGPIPLHFAFVIGPCFRPITMATMVIKG